MSCTRVKPIGLLVRSRSKLAVLASILCSFVQTSWSQAATAPQAPPTYSLTDSLRRADAKKTELNIFYVHGMGIDAPRWKVAPQEFDVSQEFRTSFCKSIQCTTQNGEWKGRDYANAGDFALGKEPPSLSYFGSRIWEPNTPDWRAAAPFVDHYQLVRKNGTTIYFHEINWWPLVLAAKCRAVVAEEAGLVDRDAKHFKTCSSTTVPYGQRFKSYTWITTDDQRRPPWPKAAVINRWLKHDILDWGFADALLAVGPLHQYLSEGIRELVLDSVDLSKAQEFVIVSHSLGSYLMFSALDTQSPAGGEVLDGKIRFDKVLTQTSHAYFLANPVSLLHLANLDDSRDVNLTTHLRYWRDRRIEAQQSPPQVVAFSDPDDLLTWEVPQQKSATGDDVIPINLPAKNAPSWFGLLENPVAAHVKYGKNKHVLQAIVPKSITGFKFSEESK